MLAKVAGAALVVTSGVAIHAAVVRTATQCRGAEGQLASVWDEGRQRAIHRAFAATGKPYAEDAWKTVSAAFEAYTRRWVAMRTEACEATRRRGEQSEEMLDLRMACLDQRLREVAALSTALTEADAQVVVKARRAPSTD